MNFKIAIQGKCISQNIESCEPSNSLKNPQLNTSDATNNSVCRHKLRAHRVVFLIMFLCSSIALQAAYTQPIWLSDGLSPMISEFMASNSNTLEDNYGKASDWCELYNPTDYSIDLSGWGLSDNLKKPFKWSFPNGIVLPSNSYLVVYLTDSTSNSASDYLHTGFKLSAEGEALLLTNPSKRTVWYFESTYPEQYNNISYGVVNNEYNYMQVPTPGKENVSSPYIPAPTFGTSHGIYTNAIALEIKALTNDMEIYYTTDCNTPSNKSTKYTEPINISKTTVVRAISYNSKGEASATATSTYIFVADVVKQPASPTGYPTQWGPFTDISGNAPGDYEMDPEVCNNTLYKDKFSEAFNSLPVVSISTDIDYLFSSSTDPDNGGIYYYTGGPINEKVGNYALGKEWERPASIEYFNPDGSEDGFQENCAIQLNGGHSRRPEKCPKHSFRVKFKGVYGVSKLNYELFDDDKATQSFNKILVKGGFGQTWTHSTTDQRTRAQYIHDNWAKDAYLEIGNVAAHTKFVHLFLNGLYWGLYNISERMDEDFAVSYWGGEPEDYDVIKDYTEALNGDLNAWNTMYSLAKADMSKTANYMKIIGKNADGSENTSYPRYIDEVSIIDYMLLNFYVGNNDWGHHNWVAARNSTTRDGFKFIVWDSELIFTDINLNCTAKSDNNCPTGVFQLLAKNSEFKMTMADRIYKHFFNDGVFTPANSERLWNNRANEVHSAIICESARWGDYRRDAHKWISNCNKLYTLNDWESAQSRMENDYLPYRTDIVIKQLIDAGFYPNIEPPVFVNEDEILQRGDKLSMTTSGGTIYYTTDGSDPRSIGGAVSSNAKSYNSSDEVAINGTTTVKARAKSGNTWSALAETFFDFGTTASVYRETNTGLASAKLYPNPARGFFYIDIDITRTSNVKVSTYDITGKLVADFGNNVVYKGNNTIKCTTEGLACGIYFCRIESNGISRTIKVNVR